MGAIGVGRREPGRGALRDDPEADRRRRGCAVAGEVSRDTASHVRGRHGCAAHHQRATDGRPGRGADANSGRRQIHCSAVVGEAREPIVHRGPGARPVRTEASREAVVVREGRDSDDLAIPRRDRQVRVRRIIAGGNDEYDTLGDCTAECLVFGIGAGVAGAARGWRPIWVGAAEAEVDDHASVGVCVDPGRGPIDGADESRHGAPARAVEHADRPQPDTRCHTDHAEVVVASTDRPGDMGAMSMAIRQVVDRACRPRSSSDRRPRSARRPSSGQRSSRCRCRRWRRRPPPHRTTLHRRHAGCRPVSTARPTASRWDLPQTGHRGRPPRWHGWGRPAGRGPPPGPPRDAGPAPASGLPRSRPWLTCTDGGP